MFLGGRGGEEKREGIRDYQLNPPKNKKRNTHRNPKFDIWTSQTRSRSVILQQDKVGDVSLVEVEDLQADSNHESLRYHRMEQDYAWVVNESWKHAHCA